MKLKLGNLFARFGRTPEDRKKKHDEKVEAKSPKKTDYSGINDEIVKPGRPTSISGKPNLPKSEKLVHYSTTPGLKQLDPNFMGTGAPSQENKQGVPNVKRSFFYREGVEPESLVTSGAKAKYSATLTPEQKLYDIYEDPEGHVASSVKELGRLDSDHYLQKIKDAGYHGFHTTHPDYAKQGVVAVFHPTDVQEDMSSIQKDESPKVNKAQAVADKYAQSKGIKLQHGIPQVKVDPSMGAKVASHFAQAKHDPSHPDVQRAYGALINETNDQFKHMLNSGLKISKIKPGQENPYKTSKDMHNDVHNNNHLWFFPTEQGFGAGQDTSNHPMLQPTEHTVDGHNMLANDVFRVVHDYFGHASEGYGFGPSGEESAYRKHHQMYSPDARRALAAETKAQNSFVNFGPNAAHNKTNPQSTIYADQKAFVAPDWIVDGHLQKSGISKSVKSPSKFTSLERLKQIKQDNYTGSRSKGFGHDYSQEEVDNLITDKKMRQADEMPTFPEVESEDNRADYSWMFNMKKRDKIPGGLAEGKTNQDFPKDKIAQGRKVEMEHTSSKDVAEEIARDHLTEDKNYYDKLKTIEKKYKSDAQRRWAHTQAGTEALGGKEAVKEWDEKSRGKDLPERIEKGARGDWKQEGYTIHYKGFDDSLKNHAGIAGHVVEAHHPIEGKIAEAVFGHNPRGGLSVSSIVKEPHRRKGLASAMYAAAEKQTGEKVNPSGQTPDAKALWSQPNRPFGKSDDQPKFKRGDRVRISRGKVDGKGGYEIDDPHHYIVHGPSKKGTPSHWLVREGETDSSKGQYHRNDRIFPAEDSIKKASLKQYKTTLNPKSLGRVWYHHAYGDWGSVPNKLDIEEYKDMVDAHHSGLWELKDIPVTSIEGHHGGHDASEEYIKDYANQIVQGSNPPPIIAKPHPEDPNKFITVDGQHRLKAAQKAGLSTIRSYVPKVGKSESLEKMSRPRITFPKFKETSTRPDQDVQLLETGRQKDLLGRKVAVEAARRIKQDPRNANVSQERMNRYKDQEQKRVAGKFGTRFLGADFRIGDKGKSYTAALAGKLRSKFEEPDEADKAKMDAHKKKVAEHADKFMNDAVEWRRKAQTLDPYSEEYRTHLANRPKYKKPRKPAKSLKDTADLSPDQMKARGRGVESTVEHEALHRVLNQIDDKYGRPAYNEVVQRLVGAHDPEALQHLSDWVERRGYNKKSSTFPEELLTHARDVLVNPKTRNNFKTFLGEEKHKDVIAKLKRGHQRAYELAQNLDPQDLQVRTPQQLSGKLAAGELEKSKNVREQKKRLFGTKGMPTKKEHRDNQIQALKDIAQRRYGLEVHPSGGKIDEKTGQRRDPNAEVGVDKPDWRSGRLESQWGPDPIAHELGHLEVVPRGINLPDTQRYMDQQFKDVQRDYGYMKQKQSQGEVQPMAAENPIRRRAGLPATSVGPKVDKDAPPRRAVDTGDVIGTRVKRGKNYYDLIRQSRFLSPENRERMQQVDEGSLKYNPEQGWVEDSSPDALVNLRGRGKVAEAIERARSRYQQSGPKKLAASELPSDEGEDTRAARAEYRIANEPVPVESGKVDYMNKSKYSAFRKKE